jgi:hypothetical protein
VGYDFDLIIDDGSHNPDDQILTAKMLMCLLKDDGFYIIEDVHINSIEKITDALQEFDCEVITLGDRPLIDDNNLIFVRRKDADTFNG